MFKAKTILFVLISLLFSSCVSDPDGYLKRSGNRKLVSNKNLYSKKKMPIQNKQYIKKAKRNIVENNYDDDYEEDDYDQDQDPRLVNRSLYMQMVAQEKARKNQNYRRDHELRELELEEREKQANQKLIHSNQQAQKELKAELQNIKAVLNETKEQIASMTCAGKNKNLSTEIPSSKQNNENKNISLIKENKTPNLAIPSEPKSNEKSQPMTANIELAPTPKK
jgi:hypothetical protein